MIQSNSNSAIDVIRKRRSIRNYDDRIVPQNIVNEIITAASCAPTSCNMQLYHFVIVNDPKVLNKFKKPVTGKINWCKQMAVLLVDPLITFENQANYISAGMVVQNFMLRATELGIGTCPIAGFKGKETLREELKIPKRFDLPLLIFFGYPVEGEVSDHVPYRVPIEQTYSYNTFGGKNPFPVTSSAYSWTQEQIIDYRQRILSVYYPRFGHSIWGKSYTAAIWPHLKKYLEGDKKVLYIFPWERTLLESLDLVIPRARLDIADLNTDIAKFTQKKFPGLIGKCFDLAEENIKPLYDTVLIVGSLEFNKDIEGILSKAADALAEGGTLCIVTIRPLGLAGLGLKALGFFGKQKDVYHNSLFYKLGPWRLISNNYLCKCIFKSNTIKFIERKNIYTDFFFSRLEKIFGNRFLRTIFRLIPETRLHVFKKEGQ